MSETGGKEKVILLHFRYDMSPT